MLHYIFQPRDEGQATSVTAAYGRMQLAVPAWDGQHLLRPIGDV